MKILPCSNHYTCSDIVPSPYIGLDPSILQSVVRELGDTFKLSPALSVVIDQVQTMLSTFFNDKNSSATAFSHSSVITETPAFGMMESESEFSLSFIKGEEQDEIVLPFKVGIRCYEGIGWSRMFDRLISHTLSCLNLVEGSYAPFELDIKMPANLTGIYEKQITCATTQDLVVNCSISKEKY